MIRKLIMVRFAAWVFAPTMRELHDEFWVGDVIPPGVRPPREPLEDRVRVALRSKVIPE